MMTMMMKLFIVATVSAAAAVGAAPLLAQQAGDIKPAATAATQACAMSGERAGRGEHSAEMQKRMREMHAYMGSPAGQGRHHNLGRERGIEQEHEH
jgi:negative regulator of sigma E activity